MIEKYDLDKLRALPIEGVAQRLGLRPVRHVTLCPFHDDRHPSLHFNVSRNTYKCYVCDSHGGPIDLVMNHLHLSFIEACKWLADDTNIILSEYANTQTVEKKTYRFDPSRYLRYFERPWLNPAARRFLFDERHLDPRVIRWCRITSWQDRDGHNWLQTPYFDTDGNLTGIQWRYLKPLIPASEPESPSRFRFPKGSKCNIYGLQILKHLKPGETLFITEGCSDCWAMLSSGHKAIAIPSATLLNRKDAKILETLNLKLETKFAMYPDADIPGERLFLQLKQVIPTLVRHSLPPGCKDFSEYYLLTVNA